ncbi:MAG: hypothetical protein P8X90_20510 [Desulfobacterales bacterium]
MRRIMICLLLIFFVPPVCQAAFANQNPSPFGFQIGRMTYEACLGVLSEKKWTFQEYEKKQFKMIDAQSPERGKNTFILASPRELKGLKGIRLFFSSQSTLDALIVNLEPNLFEIVMNELDDKYELVQKNLMGEDFTDNYTHVLWQKGDTYIELQRLGPHFVRLVYVEKVLYENYKTFLFKTYESFRRRSIKPEWMDDL